MGHVCPVWIGYLLSSRWRKRFQDPAVILKPYVREGMTVVDVGCAMGFFTLEMPELVGAGGRVVGIDLQPKMLEVLKKRAGKRGIADRIELRTCGKESLNAEELDGQVDFALVFAVVHEVPDAAKLFVELHGMLRPGGRLLVAEPKGHVRIDAFAEEAMLAEDAGFVFVESPAIKRSHAMVLERA